MQNRLKIALVVAVFFGLIAAYGIYNFLRQQRQTAESSLRQETQNVVVAAKEIPAGTAFNDDMIKKGMVKAVQWPKASVPAGFFLFTRAGRRQDESGKDHGE